MAGLKQPGSLRPPARWRRGRGPATIGIWFAAMLAVARYLSTLPPPLPLPRGATWGLSLGVAAGLLLGLAGLLADRAPRESGLRQRVAYQLLAGCARGWWVVAPLLLLLGTDCGVSPPLLATISAGLVVVALVAQSLRSHAAVGLIARPSGRVGLWELGLLWLAACVACLYLVIGARAEGNFQNDSAYHFGVARYIATTGQWAEPIVWHYLSVPDQLIHAPFDYWGELTSLLLVPWLVLLGPSHDVALLVMTTVSALSVVAFWHLVCVAAPPRRALLQLIALAVFACSPSVANYRFDTESLPLYHLLLIGALIAFARHQHGWCVGLGALLVLTRRDGILSFGILTLAAWVSVRRCAASGGARRRLAALTGVAAAGLLLHSWHLSGTLAPTAAGALWLQSQQDLYSFTADAAPSPAALDSRLSPAFVTDQLAAVLATFRIAQFVPAADAWLALSLVGGLPLLRGRLGHAQLPVLLLLVVAPCTALLAPAVFVSWRSLHPLLPALVLAGVYGADQVLDLISRPTPGDPHPVAAPRLAAGAATVACAILYPQWRLHGARAPAVVRAGELALQRVDPQLAGQPVAATLPWYVIANTASPALAIPENGEDAIEAALSKYGIQWLALIGSHQWMRASRPVLDAIAAGDKLRLGSLRLAPHPADQGLLLYRVIRPP